MGEQGATRYRLVVQGFRARHGESLADVLERVLGMPPARAQELARNIPCAIGATAQAEHARHYAAALTESGAELRVEPPLPAADSAPSSAGYALGELSLQRPLPPSRPAAAEPVAPRLDALAFGALTPQTSPNQHGLSGLRDLGESLAALASAHAPIPEVDPDALRAIRPQADPRQQRTSSFVVRLIQWILRPLAHGVGGILSGTLAFTVVMVITAAAVSYALDPDHVLDAVAFARAKQSVQALVTNLTETLSRVLPTP